MHIRTRSLRQLIRVQSSVAVLSVLTMSLLGIGCQKAYYSTLEQFGWHKRDVLVSRVAEARDDQQQAKEQFKSALEQFKAVVGFDGGELEATYDKLNEEFLASKEAAENVTSRVDKIEDVAQALFAEWESELEQYNSEQLRQSSQQQLTQTRARYEQMIRAMRKAEASMEPVLAAFSDQVLFLKHNLNARAIASLDNAATKLESEIAELVRQMESSIEQADAFIASMGGAGQPAGDGEDSSS